MYLNFFATSMLLSIASAIDLEVLSETHPQSKVDSYTDGSVEMQEMQPDDNCCYLYFGNNFTEKFDEQ